MKRKNTNCLAGWRCPECKSLGPFKIAASVVLEMTDDGCSDAGSDQEWDDDSYARCCGCDLEGIVRDFDEDYQKRKITISKEAK